MAPFGSTLTGPSGAGAAELTELAECPPDELAVLLVPLVTRAVRTRRGPVALVRWLRRPEAAPLTERAAPAVAADLARFLFTAPGPQDDTLDDA